MPGPMSAPNGIANTYQERDPKKPIVTGKTAKKRGTLVRKPRKQLTRKQRDMLENGED